MHNLNKQNGRTSFVYREGSEPPWHRLGTAVPAEEMTADRILETANMDYEVVLKPLYTAERKFVQHAQATQRTDTGTILGVVGRRYQIAQNRSAFDFFNTVAREGNLQYETAGVLGEGQRVWVMAKMPTIDTLADDERLERWLLWMNSHDGSTTVKFLPTYIRVVCQNTLTFSLNRAAITGRLRHSGNIEMKMKFAATLLRETGEFFDELKHSFAHFQRERLPEQERDRYWTSCLRGPQIKDTRALTRELNVIRQLSEDGRGVTPSNRGTLWTDYNAVTEYVDHHRKQSSDVNSILIEGGANIKARAYRLACELTSKEQQPAN